MSYYITQHDDGPSIPADKARDAVIALTKAFDAENDIEDVVSPTVEQYESYLENILVDLGMEVFVHNEGSLHNFDLGGYDPGRNTYDGLVKVYDTIAPFVEEGYETTFSGEEGDQFIFLFTNGTAIETTREALVHGLYAPLVKIAFKDKGLAARYVNSPVGEISTAAKEALES